MPDAPKILQRNVYGWFVRVERGVNGLTEGGKAALVRWKEHLPPPGNRPSNFAHRSPNRFDHAISIMLRPIAGSSSPSTEVDRIAPAIRKLMGSTRP